MIKGLRTVKVPVPDLARAKAWYGDVFGAVPYFDQPFYVGFAIGGFELGLVPDGTPGIDGAVVYWGVDAIDADAVSDDVHSVTVHDDGIEVIVNFEDHDEDDSDDGRA